MTTEMKRFGHYQIFLIVFDHIAGLHHGEKILFDLADLSISLNV